jgi:hypothetical protein
MKLSAGIKWLAAIAMLATSFIFPGSVHAQGIVYGDNLPAGVTVDHDVLLVGQNVSLAGIVNGNVLVLGNQVSISGTVDGSLILIGQNAVISGKVSGAVYSVALTLELGAAAQLNRDLYVSTVSLVSQPGSQVGRDLFAVSLDAGLNGQIGRAPHTAIGPIQLYNGVMQLLGFNEFTIKLHIEMPAPAPGQGSHTFPVVLSTPRPVHARMLSTDPKPFDWGKWAMGQARDWIVLAIFGMVAFWTLRHRLEQAGMPLAFRPWRTLGIGLLALVIAVNLFSVALLLAILIFCIGLGMNYIGLWQLSIALWIAAYACIALALVALWFFVVYGTKIIVVTALANWLARKFVRNPAWLEPVLLVLGLLIYLLLRSVPYIGWVIGTLVTAAGLGSAWLARRGTTLPAPPPVPAPLAETAAAPAKRVVARSKG